MILRSGRTTGSDEKRRRVLAAAITVHLLISEVIVLLPAKSIARCRCVCRSWRAAIAAAAFVRRHRELSRARPPSSCMLSIPREIDATTTAISFCRVQLPSPGHTNAGADADPIFDTVASHEPDAITPIVYLAHCDGLVAITTTTGRVFVCNPATREFVALPRGTHNAELHCRKPTRLPPVAPIGFDQWRNSYVVARYFYRMYGERIFFDEATGDEWWSEDYVDDIGHEVFTLGGGGGSWERTEDPPHAIGGVQRPVCTRRGFYYWLSDVSKPQLLRFGLQHRTFEVVSRPPTTVGGSNHLGDMAFLDGKLCYVHAAAKGAASHIWMANDDDDEGLELQWSLLCRVDITDPVLDLYYSDFMPAGIVDDGDDTLVAAANEMLFRCKLFGGRMDGVAVDMQQPQLQHSLVPYFETLVSPTACNY